MKNCKKFTNICSPFNNSETNDGYFNSIGVRYVKDQVTGKCVSAALSNSSFDVSPNTTVYNNGNASYILHMKNPMQLFYLDNNYAYTGQVSKHSVFK